MRELVELWKHHDYLLPRILLGGLWLAGVLADVRANKPEWIVADVVLPPVGIYRGLDHILTRNPY